MFFLHTIRLYLPALQNRLYLMKLYKFLFIFPAFVAFFNFTASAQNVDEVLNQVIAKSAKAYSDVPLEKVYLHFDKPYYAVGDTIWFKVYETYNLHVPSPISKIVYVDIPKSRHTIHWCRQAKLLLKNGVAWGQFCTLSIRL